MKWKSQLRFDKQERSGIFFLLLIIVLLQAAYIFFSFFPRDVPRDSLTVDKELQTQIDGLKEAALLKDSVKIYPFNPNFITDYKGYALGMSTHEIDRLQAFRKQNKFANTPEEFQKVTQVSDSLLDAISPYFKFPEWTKKGSKQWTVNSKQYSENGKPFPEGSGQSKRSSTLVSDGRRQEDAIGSGEFSSDSVKDLNTANAEELRAVSGIGEKLSARIVKFRDRLGGFLVEEQLYDVYGLEPEVVERTLKRFKVLRKPDIQKINLNTASADEISKLVYIPHWVAERIVDYRGVNGGIISLGELNNIEGFPSDKIDRIALYLSQN